MLVCVRVKKRKKNLKKNKKKTKKTLKTNTNETRSESQGLQPKTYYDTRKILNSHFNVKKCLTATEEEEGENHAEQECLY